MLVQVQLCLTNSVQMQSHGLCRAATIHEITTVTLSNYSTAQIAVVDGFGQVHAMTTSVCFTKLMLSNGVNPHLKPSPVHIIGSTRLNAMKSESW